MKKRLLSAIACTVLLCIGIAAKANPLFTGGGSQYLPVCENGGSYLINSLFIVSDTSTGTTDTWSVLSGASHGTLAIAYSATSAATLLYPSGLTYTPATGYSGTDTFSVVVSDGTLSDTTTILVTVGPLPNPGIITGTDTMCTGTSAVFVSSGTPGGTWSATPHIAIVAGTGAATAITAGGADSVSYVVTNTCGIAVTHHRVYVLQHAYAGFVSGSTMVCNGSALSVTPVTPGGTWSASNTNITISGSTLTGAAAGLDTLTYIVTNTCSVDTSVTVFTIQDPLTTAGTISGPVTGCEGVPLPYTASITGGSWSHWSATGSISSTGALTAGAGPTDTVIYTLSNSCGAITATAGVTITALPDAGTISGYDSVCAGSTIVMTASVPGGVWSSAIPEFAAVDAVGNVTGGLNGSTVIMYTVFNICGASVANHPVRVNVPAQPISGESTLCQGQVGTYMDNVSGGTWSSSSLINALPIPILPGNFLGGLVGSATIIYTVDNACGTTEAQLDIEVIDCGTANVANVNAMTGMIVAPNPGVGNFTIRIPAAVNGTSIAVITNMLGQVVAEIPMNTNTPAAVSLNVPSGVYNISARLNGEVYTTKLVINR